MVTVSSAEDHADGADAWNPASPSADGRYVAFASSATNLVAADTNGRSDVFVRDRASGTTERVSVSSAGVQGNSASAAPAISADGRYVVFSSSANNLVADDTNGASDIFLRDRVAGTTTRVSLGTGDVVANNSCFLPSISADGTTVAFSSDADNLVSGDTNGSNDIFVRHLASGVTTRASVTSAGVQANSASATCSLSADGRFVAFWSWATNLAETEDTNAQADVFVRDRTAGTTTRVNVGWDGAQATGYSEQFSISSDGQYVAFSSSGNGLVPVDDNSVSDAFVRGPLHAGPLFSDGFESGTTAGWSSAVR